MADGKDLASNDPIAGKADAPELDPRIQLALGRALQAHYDDLVRAPMPDRFLVLLAELEAKEKREAQNGS